MVDLYYSCCRRRRRSNFIIAGRAYRVPTADRRRVLSGVLDETLPLIDWPQTTKKTFQIGIYAKSTENLRKIYRKSTGRRRVLSGVLDETLPLIDWPQTIKKKIQFF